jgi:hypothetical protein
MFGQYYHMLFFLFFKKNKQSKKNVFFLFFKKNKQSKKNVPSFCRFINNPSLSGDEALNSN